MNQAVRYAPTSERAAVGKGIRAKEFFDQGAVDGGGAARTSSNFRADGRF